MNNFEQLSDDLFDHEQSCASNCFFQTYVNKALQHIKTTLQSIFPREIRHDTRTSLIYKFISNLEAYYVLFTGLTSYQFLHNQ